MSEPDRPAAAGRTKCSGQLPEVVTRSGGIVLPRRGWPTGWACRCRDEAGRRAGPALTDWRSPLPFRAWPRPQIPAVHSAGDDPTENPAPTRKQPFSVAIHSPPNRGPRQRKPSERLARHSLSQSPSWGLGVSAAGRATTASRPPVAGHRRNLSALAGNPIAPFGQYYGRRVHLQLVHALRRPICNFVLSVGVAS